MTENKPNKSFRRRSSSFFKSFKNTEPETEEHLYFDRGATAAAQNRWVFEVAWEVANKGRTFLLSFISFLGKAIAVGFAIVCIPVNALDLIVIWFCAMRKPRNALHVNKNTPL